MHLYGEEQSMKPTEEKIQSNASDLPVYVKNYPCKNLKERNR